MKGIRITDASLDDADISGDIEGARVNGVEIGPFVRAELDRRNPERVKLRSDRLGELREAWTMLEDLWARTTERAGGLPQELLDRRVDGEWSFVETLRHLLFANDCWVARAIHGTRRPYHRWGLPWSGAGAQWSQQIGLDLDAKPTLSELLPLRQDRQARTRSTLENLTDADLRQVRAAPEEPGHPTGDHDVLHCLHVICNEEWEHHRYAVRDLDVLAPEEP